MVFHSRVRIIFVIIFIGNPFLRWGFLIWVLILLRTFVLILVVFDVLLKTARSEIWPKRSEKNNKNYQDEDKSPQ